MNRNIMYDESLYQNKTQNTNKEKKDE